MWGVRKRTGEREENHHNGEDVFKKYRRYLEVGKCIKVFFSIRHITTALPGRAGQPYGGRSPT